MMKKSLEEYFLPSSRLTFQLSIPFLNNERSIKSFAAFSILLSLSGRIQACPSLSGEKIMVLYTQTAILRETPFMRPPITRIYCTLNILIVNVYF